MKNKYADVADYLQSLVDEMRAGKWRGVDLAVLVFRDAEDHRIVTICPWSEGEEDRKELAELAGSAAGHLGFFKVN